MSFTTQIITNRAEFCQLETEWQNLLERSPTNQIFQSFTFLHSWWQQFRPGKLNIVTIRDSSGKLMALAPLYTQVDKQKIQLNFIGCINVSDYLDILVDNFHQDELYTKLLTTIKLLPWQSLSWCSLPDASPTRKWLKKIFTKNHVQEVVQDINPQIILPNTWDEYLLTINRKQHHEIRRKERRLKEHQHSFEEIKTPCQTDIDDFIYLHKQSSANKREFWDTTHLKFFRQVLPALGQHGWLRLFFLKIGGKRAASMLVFDYNDQFQLYNSGFLLREFRELSVGSILTAHTIKRAIEEKKLLYDFLRGNESYKFHYTNIAKPIFDITIMRHHASK